MNRTEAKAKASKASDTLDRIADSVGDTVWERLKAWRYTWAVVGVVVVLAGYGVYKIVA